MTPQMKFHTVAIAGTFDRLHKGHKYFISEAFKHGERVIIGLTSDKYAQNKLQITNDKFQINDKLKITNYETRKRELEEFLQKEGLERRAEIVAIDNVYGPATENNEIEALVVTSETFDGAQKVNRKRKELGFRLLKILKIPFILAEDQKRIASTRIRWGEIDRWGKLYISNIKYQKSKISQNLRQALKKPLGKLVRGSPDDLGDAAEELKKTVAATNPTIIITVGDEVTKLCNEVGIIVNLSIFDYKVGRKEKYHSLSDLGFKSAFARGTLANGLVTVKNPPGYITTELVKAVKDAIPGIITDGKQRIIEVDGEEDLAGVPAILLAPLGSLVIYGQPGEGIVVVEVTEEMKQKLLVLLGK